MVLRCSSENTRGLAWNWCGEIARRASTDRTARDWGDVVSLAPMGLGICWIFRQEAKPSDLSAGAPVPFWNVGVDIWTTEETGAKRLGFWFWELGRCEREARQVLRLSARLVSCFFRIATKVGRASRPNCKIQLMMIHDDLRWLVMIWVDQLGCNWKSKYYEVANFKGETPEGPPLGFQQNTPQVGAWGSELSGALHGITM